MQIILPQIKELLMVEQVKWLFLSKSLSPKHPNFWWWGRCPLFSFRLPYCRLSQVNILKHIAGPCILFYRDSALLIAHFYTWTSRQGGTQILINDNYHYTRMSHITSWSFYICSQLFSSLMIYLESWKVNVHC